MVIYALRSVSNSDHSINNEALVGVMPSQTAALEAEGMTLMA